MKQRLLENMISKACERQNIEFRAHSDGWLLELQKGDRVQRVLGTDFGLNDQVAAAIAKDKVATSLMLGQATIKHVEHRLVRSHRDEIDVVLLTDMLTRSPVVIKPLVGSHGELVTFATTIERAYQVMTRSSSLSWAVSPYYDVHVETRVVVVDNTIRLVHQKIDPVVRDGLKLFNLHVGAKAIPVVASELSTDMSRMAIDAMAALGLRIAAIDIITTVDGVSYILEVNAAFSLNRFAASSERAYQMTATFYDELVGGMFA